MNKDQFNKKLINYIANYSIGTSTLRNQGAPKVIEITRNYLKDLNLKDFFKALKNEKNYIQYLNSHSIKLMNNYPGVAKGNFGAARKGLNIYFRNIMYHLNLVDNKKQFRNYEDFNEKIKLLEIPLDKYTSKEIKKGTNLIWPSIRKLDAKTNIAFQLEANKIAKKENIARVNLDIKWWRDGN